MVLCVFSKLINKRPIIILKYTIFLWLKDLFNPFMLFFVETFMRKYFMMLEKQKTMLNYEF